jgi:hypothetical protein
MRGIRRRGLSRRSRRLLAKIAAAKRADIRGHGIKIALARLAILLLAALSHIAELPSFMLLLIAVCRRQGHRQEPARYRLQLICRICQAGTIATIA